MNITIINTYDISGGAARAAFRLYKGLRNIGQDACMIVRHKKSVDKNIFSVIENEGRLKSDTLDLMKRDLINHNRTKMTNTLFSLPYPGYGLSETNIIKATDIINLHWVAKYQSVDTISKLLELNKPVVWTLHDMWPFTGGCHYSAGCRKYETDCQDCPQLKNNQYQIPFKVLQNKIEQFTKNLTIVTPSRWLADCARESRVFKNFKTVVISNSLETDIFKPLLKKESKQHFHLDPDVVTILFGTADNNEQRKGFSNLLKVFKLCAQDERFHRYIREKKVRIMTFGRPSDDLKKTHLPMISIGEINSDEELARIYSAADIFVLPSLEDNLPNTMLEAMACGTPVISYDVGGMPDVIENDKTGYFVPKEDNQKMAQMILNLIFDGDKRKKMSQSCRELAEARFRLGIQAKNYLQLFGELVKKSDRCSVQGQVEYTEKKIIAIEGRISSNFKGIYRKYKIIIFLQYVSKLLKRLLRRPYHLCRNWLRKL